MAFAGALSTALCLLTFAYGRANAYYNPSPIVKDDVFVFKSGTLQHKLMDENGETWYKASKGYRLEVLANDIIKYPHHKTCILDKAKHLYYTPGKKVHFKDIAKKAGITQAHRTRIPIDPFCSFDLDLPKDDSVEVTKLRKVICSQERATGGAAVGDYDNDGHQDVFISVFHGRSVLYRNNGDGTFTDVTLETGIGPKEYGNGAVWVDIDQDGDLDLYVTTLGNKTHHLYVNYGGHFKEEADIRGVALEQPSGRSLGGMTPAIGDFNNDGYPDIYASEWIISSKGKPSASRLLKNHGASNPGYFEDVTDSAGVNMDPRPHQHNSHLPYRLNGGTHVFGASFTDFNNDGHQDLLISADMGRSKLFWNDGSGKFTECTNACGLDVVKSPKGHAVGDWNNDKYLDWFSSGAYSKKTKKGNKLFENLGSKKFQDVTNEAGVQNGGHGWGAAFLDFNNDGHSDIVLNNGNDAPYNKETMKMFKNEGPNKKMEEVASDIGLKFNGAGRGLLKFDFDNDGDEDILIVPNVGKPLLYENVDGNQASWLRVRVAHKCGKKSDKLCDSLGARVTVTDLSGNKQTKEIGSNSHYLGQSEIIAHFGVGPQKHGITVKVFWPSNKQTLVISNVKSRQTIVAIRPDGRSQHTRIPRIEECLTMRIRGILEKPTKGYIMINPDGKSITLKPPPGKTLQSLGVQHITYAVELVSPSKHQRYRRDAHHLYNRHSHYYPRPRHHNRYHYHPGHGKHPHHGRITVDTRLRMPSHGKCPSGRTVKISYPTNKRRFDGVSNNRHHLFYGAANENLRRLLHPDYADGISLPAATCLKHEKAYGRCKYPNANLGHGCQRPTPRLISNVLFRQVKAHFSRRHVSDFHIYFGQFMSHDTDLSVPTEKNTYQKSPVELKMPIGCPKGDVHFDQASTGHESLPFTRFKHDTCTGAYPHGKPRTHINTISSFIDGNTVYGSSDERAKKLRTMKNGELILNKHGLLPKNTVGIKMANNIGRPPKELRMAGDVRANVAPGLFNCHTLFVREHNRLCKEYRKTHPGATDEEIYQYARKIVIAELQAITFREYIAAIVGKPERIPPYKGYNPKIDPAVSTAFSTAAFRFGHSQVNALVWRLDKNWKVHKYGHMLLRETYFHPERIENEDGMEPIFRGSVYFPAQEIDTMMVDEMRNVLFPKDRKNGLDLASINIQRGRDMGLPDLNKARKYLGLKPHRDFNDITSDHVVASKLRKLYGKVDHIDLWVGGLAEDHVPGAELGPTFLKIFMESMLRVRDGDRYWYENHLSQKEIDYVHSLNLGKIIRLNTEFKDCPENVFFSARHCKDSRSFYQCEKKYHPTENIYKENNELMNENEKLKRIIEDLRRKGGHHHHHRAYKGDAVNEEKEIREYNGWEMN